jgi:hypothetical protein
VSKKKGKPDEVVCRENVVRLKGKRKGGYLKETVRMLKATSLGMPLHTSTRASVELITAGFWATTTPMTTTTAILWEK